MTSGKQDKKSRILGIGRDRKFAVQRIMEAIVKIMRAERRSSLVRFSAKHFELNVDGTRFILHAPYCFQLDVVSESRYLTSILSSDPITEPFGLQIWTPDQKVLFAEYNGFAVEIMSFRRGDWEIALISAAADIAGSVLQIEPTAKARSVRPFTITLTAERWKSLWDKVLHPKTDGLSSHHLLDWLLDHGLSFEPSESAD